MNKLINDPIQTRYFKNASVTVNGLTCYPLALNTSGTLKTESYTGGNYMGCTVACDVAVRHSDGTETVIGSKVAQVSVADGAYRELHTNTWACPQTSLASTDSIVVRVYAEFGTTWYQIGSSVFSTEQLGGSQLNSATWTFYYYLGFTYNSATRRGSVEFDFDGVCPSRIENFSWSAVSKVWHDIAFWTFQLLTRKWNNISTFALTLQTRTWQNIASWTFNLLTETWHEIATWIFQLQTQKWHEITSWVFQLATKKWNDIGLWNFQTLTRKWHDLTQWTFQVAIRTWNSIAYWTWQTITYGWHTITEWTFTLISHGWHNIATWIFTIETTIGRAFPFIILIGGIFTIAITLFIIFKH